MQHIAQPDLRSNPRAQAALDQAVHGAKRVRHCSRTPHSQAYPHYKQSSPLSPQFHQVMLMHTARAEVSLSDDSPCPCACAAECVSLPILPLLASALKEESTCDCFKLHSKACCWDLVFERSVEPLQIFGKPRGKERQQAHRLACRCMLLPCDSPFFTFGKESAQQAWTIMDAILALP